MENKENIIPVCKSCTIQRKKEWQKANKNLEIKRGDYIKGAFKVGKIAEHMWMLVQKTEKGIIYGELSNEPIDERIANHYQIGQKVKLKFSEIEDHMNGKKE